MQRSKTTLTHRTRRGDGGGRGHRRRPVAARRRSTASRTDRAVVDRAGRRQLDARRAGRAAAGRGGGGRGRRRRTRTLGSLPDDAGRPRRLTTCRTRRCRKAAGHR